MWPGSLTPVDWCDYPNPDPRPLWGRAGVSDPGCILTSDTGEQAADYVPILEQGIWGRLRRGKLAT
jgi:hypothetical protein